MPIANYMEPVKATEDDTSPAELVLDDTMIDDDAITDEFEMSALAPTLSRPPSRGAGDDLDSSAWPVLPAA
jgi:hypothetical protein